MINLKRYCKCGCGQEVEIKPWHKYEGTPEYIKGHHNKGNKRQRSKLELLDPQDRPKKYQNGFWIAEQVRERWVPLKTIAKEQGVSTNTLSKYLAEVGITLNRITEDKARALEDESDDTYAVFLPGTKNDSNKISSVATFLMHKSYLDDNSFYTIVRKIFVEGVGLAYTSKELNSVILTANIELSRERDAKYEIESITPLTVKAERDLQEQTGVEEYEYVDILKESFGKDVEVVWY